MLATNGARSCQAALCRRQGPVQPMRVVAATPLHRLHVASLAQRRSGRRTASEIRSLSGSVATSGGGSTGSGAPPPAEQPAQQQQQQSTTSGAVAGGAAFLMPLYIVLFTALFVGAALFAAMSLQVTGDMGFGEALGRITRRVVRSVAFRQLLVIAGAILLVRFALNNVLRLLAQWSRSPVPWDKSKLYYVMKEVYSPLELLLFVAGCCTMADSFLPQLVGVPKAVVNAVVRAVLSMSFILGAATVVFNLKSRFCKEQAWQCEMQGNVTSQRRWEAYDKMGTFAIYAVSTFLSIQALGLEVRSVLAIGGIGGLAIGLAGREICENILNGFLLMTTMPFEVGDEIVFSPNGTEVEGIVLDVGWYRTTVRSFEREVFVIPNAVFSKNTVLNVTRKMREWRFFERLCLRVRDVHKANAIIQDVRRIVRNDSRIINKLHRRIFLDKITHEDCQIYLSFYVEASNRDAFMAVKQDLLLAFVDCVERNGAALSTRRLAVDVADDSVAAVLAGMYGGAAAAAAARFNLLPEPPAAAVDVTVTPITVATVDGSDGDATRAAAAAAAGKEGGGAGAAGGGGGGGGGSNGNGKAPAAAPNGNGRTAAAQGAGAGGDGSAPPAAADGSAGAGGSNAAAAGGAAAAPTPRPPRGRRGALEAQLRGFLQQLFTDDPRRGQQ